MKHATSRALYDYWNRVRGNRAAPERSEMKPEAIRTILGDVVILEADNAFGYKVRLAGTQICSLLGRELRGLNLTQSFAPDTQTEFNGLLESVARGIAPLIVTLVGETEDRRMVGLELLLLPLKHHGRTNTRLIGSIAPITKPYWLGHMPVVSLRVHSSRFLNQEDVTVSSRTSSLAASITRAFGKPQLRLVQGGRS